MVSVSRETTAQTERRLREVLRRADLDVLAGEWTYVEHERDGWAGPHRSALAVVVDGDRVSELVPVDEAADEAVTERFAVLSFHFADEPENSGFVGWLATHLKARLGTGVAVVCGYNRARGGVYDYWGLPPGLLAPALELLRELGAERVAAR